MVYYWTVRLKHKRTFHLSWTQEFSRVVLQDVSENSNCCLRARWTKLNTQIDFSLCCILIICCYKDHRKMSNHLVGATGDLTKENSKITIKKKKTFVYEIPQTLVPAEENLRWKDYSSPLSLRGLLLKAENEERGQEGKRKELREIAWKWRWALKWGVHLKKRPLPPRERRKKKKSIHEVHHSTSTVSSLFFKKGTICLLCSMNHSIRVGVFLSFIFLEISFFFQDNKRN